MPYQTPKICNPNNLLRLGMCKYIFKSDQSEYIPYACCLSTKYIYVYIYMFPKNARNYLTKHKTHTQTIATNSNSRPSTR